MSGPTPAWVVETVDDWDNGRRTLVAIYSTEVAAEKCRAREAAEWDDTDGVRVEVRGWIIDPEADA